MFHSLFISVLENTVVYWPSTPPNIPFQRQRKWHISDGQSWGDIEWAIELLYNSVKTGSQWVLETSWWEDVPERLGPQAPGWAIQENENDTRLYSEGLGRSICCSSVWSPTPSHTQIFQIKWEVYFSKNCVARLYYCVNMYSACTCVYAYEYTTIQL